MTRTPMMRALRYTALTLGFVMVMIGVFFFVMGLLAYMAGDTTIIAYRPLLISATMIAIPGCVYFLYKLWGYYKAQQNKYDLPDTPLKFYVFIMMFSGFFLLMTASLAIYIITL